MEMEHSWKMKRSRECFFASLSLFRFLDSWYTIGKNVSNTNNVKDARVCVSIYIYIYITEIRDVEHRKRQKKWQTWNS